MERLQSESFDEAALPDVEPHEWVLRRRRPNRVAQLVVVGFAALCVSVLLATGFFGGLLFALTRTP